MNFVRVVLSLVSLALLVTASGADVCAWEGASLSSWVKGSARHVGQPRLEEGLFKGTVTGLDPNVYVRLPAPVLTKVNHVLYLKMKTTVGGKAQFFWLRPQDKDASGSRMSEVGVSSDGQWHTYRMLLDWFDEGVSVDRLRFDLQGSEDPYDFEIASVKIVEEGEVQPPIEAKDYKGVAFSLQMPKGVHYCTIEWLRAGGKLGFYYFSPATDGLKHDYWFDLTEASRPKVRDRFWSGRIVRCRVRQRKYGRDLPVENFRYVKARPDLPADVSIVTAHANEAIPRAGRPLTVEVLLRNYGTQPSAPISFSVDGLPQGVCPQVQGVCPHAAGVCPQVQGVCPQAAGVCPQVQGVCPQEPIPGSMGQDSVLVKYRYLAPPLVNERRYVLTLPDLGVGTHRFGVSVHCGGQTPVSGGQTPVSGGQTPAAGGQTPAAGGQTPVSGGQTPRRAEVVVEVKPSLGLAKCDYPPEPKPVKTGAYQVGAIIFPGWTRHSWEPDWNRAPWRKPVLGWYDESKPETIDWQIKQLVENGFSFVCVNWYWDRKERNNLWPTVFAQARYRKHLKWFLQWSNHNAPGSHSIEDQTNVVRYWIKNYFSDSQYMRVDGKPVVAIYCPQNMEKDMKDRGGCRALMELTRREVAAAGLPGIYLIGMRGVDRDSRAFMQPFEEMGFDATTVYHYTASQTPGAPLAADGSRPYKWVAESSYAHWKRLAANSKLPVWPSLSTGRDDRIWNGEHASLFITGNSAADFKTICRAAKRFSDETRQRYILMAPLDEWSEGEIGYPNMEHGFGFFEAARDTFGIKGSEGWPINSAPEDVGLVCPQFDLYQYR